MSVFKCVVFRIGQEKYALDIRFVNSITEHKEITKVPDVKPEILGVVDLRGDIIPIINLGKKLNKNNNLAQDSGKIIIIDFNGLSAGFLVDEASRVLQFKDEEVESPPSLLKGHDMELIKGILKVDGEIVVLLELEKVFEMIKGFEQ